MVNKYIKQCSASLEMQIKTLLSFHFTPVRMAIIKKTKNSQALVAHRRQRSGGL
jgi:hypothetical protein